MTTGTASFLEWGEENDLSGAAALRPVAAPDGAQVAYPDRSTSWQVCVDHTTREALYRAAGKHGLPTDILQAAHAEGWIGVFNSQEFGECLAVRMQDGRGVVVGWRYLTPTGEWHCEPPGCETCALVVGNPNAQVALIFNDLWDALAVICAVGEAGWKNALSGIFTVIVAFGASGSMGVAQVARRCKQMLLWPRISAANPNTGDVSVDEWLERMIRVVGASATLRRVQTPPGHNSPYAWCQSDKPDFLRIWVIIHAGEHIETTIAVDGGRACNAPLASLMDIAAGRPDPRKTVLGNRFLCIGGTMLFVGPSGIGKSSASVQQDILWSLGREAFGIRPARPLRILTIQAENDAEDLAEMRDGVCRGLKLSDQERAEVRQRVFYETVNDLRGEELLAYLDRRLSLMQFDIVRIDPLLAYIAGDVKNAEHTAAFLRTGLNPLLIKQGVACIVNHHTPKVTNRDTSDWRSSDWMYAGAGAADITNWARAILVIDPTHADHVFKFIAAKRGKRIGWVDADDKRQTVRYYCHAPDGIYWLESTEADIAAMETAAAAKKARKPVKTAAGMKDLVPGEDAIPKVELLKLAMDRGFSKHLADSTLKELLENGELFKWKVKRSGTNDEVRISRHPQSPGQAKE